MEDTVTDGEVTVFHVVIPLTIDEVDFETDTIRGTGVPGAGIELFSWPEVEEREEGEVPARRIHESASGRSRLARTSLFGGKATGSKPNAPRNRRLSCRQLRSTPMTLREEVSDG